VARKWALWRPVAPTYRRPGPQIVVRAWAAAPVPIARNRCRDGFGEPSWFAIPNQSSGFPRWSRRSPRCGTGASTQHPERGRSHASAASQRARTDSAVRTLDEPTSRDMERHMRATRSSSAPRASWIMVWTHGERVRVRVQRWRGTRHLHGQTAHDHPGVRVILMDPPLADRYSTAYRSGAPLCGRQKTLLWRSFQIS
jgi:hypothetical protein